MEEYDQVLINARRDPNYCPYCMRCPGLVRMKKVEDLYWKCSCGAEHDIRYKTEDPPECWTRGGM